MVAINPSSFLSLLYLIQSLSVKACLAEKGSYKKTKVGYYFVGPDNAAMLAAPEKFQVELDVDTRFVNKTLSNITICFRIQLHSKGPACLLDLAGLQFFYTSPEKGTPTEKVHMLKRKEIL